MVRYQVINNVNNNDDDNALNLMGFFYACC